MVLRKQQDKGFIIRQGCGSGEGRAYTGARRPPNTYTVQLALPPQVVGVSELLEGVLKVDSYQGSQHSLERKNIIPCHLGYLLLLPLPIHT
jgi:hypothetical protein